MDAPRIGAGGSVPERDPAQFPQTLPADSAEPRTQDVTGVLGGLSQSGMGSKVKSEPGHAKTSASFGNSTQSAQPNVSQKQVDALIDSARQIGDLPEAERLGAFERVFAQALNLPEHQRVAPLSELVGQFSGLPEADSRHFRPLFRRLFDQILSLPEDQRDGLPAKLIGQIGFLPFPGKPLEFQRVFERIIKLPDHLRGEPLAALAAKQFHLSLEVVNQLEMYERIFDETLRLPPNQRSEPLAAVASMVSGEPLRKFDRVFEEILRLPDDQRGPPLAALARRQVTLLPEAQQLPAFLRIFDQHFRLPDDQRGKLLAVLAAVLGRLPAEAMSSAFARIVDQILHLPDDQLGKPLAELARQVQELPADVRQPVLARLIDQVNRVPEDQRSEPLVELACVVWWLPVDHRQRAFGRVLDQILLGPPGGRPLAALTGQIALLPQEVQRLDAFERVIDPILRLSNDELLAFEDHRFGLPFERADLLAALVKRFAKLPEFLLQPVFEMCVDSVVRLPTDQQGQWLAALHNLAKELHPADQEQARAMLARQPLDEDDGFGFGCGPSRTSHCW